ncbi:MAG: hypothetical protein HZC54_09160 [Verrucomicrobia bacterium]|nr:hypothetical protein [Verrucomicrobiota bacterium]
MTCLKHALTVCLGATLAFAASVAAEPPAARDLGRLERSFWLNASLASPTLGYWGASFPRPRRPAGVEIANAARLLTRDAAANRLYLIYHHELPLDEACDVFLAWRKACPPEVELVPTLVLRMYDKKQTPAFTTDELASLCGFFKSRLQVRRVAVYDVYAKRDQGAGLAVLAKHFPSSLVRVGLQPGEPLAPPFVAAVADTWSGFCHGLTNDDWRSPGFGAGTLRKWVVARNNGVASVAWDLITVAWDYSATKRGEYPGYDDANKNQPLPAGRNCLAVTDILAAAAPGKLAGFSSDLLILQLNSASAAHDGAGGAFYETLKQGRGYDGFYAGPWREITAIYQTLRAGRPLPVK